MPINLNERGGASGSITEEKVGNYGGVDETNHLLLLILQELQVMNAYNEMAHDEHLNIEDLDNEHN